MRLMGFDVLRRESWHRGPRPVVEPGTVHTDEQSRVTVSANHSFNSALIKRNVIFRRNRHEVVRRESLRIDLRQQFPLVPAVVVLSRSQTKRLEGLGPAKEPVTHRPRKKPRQHGMVRLPNQDELVALLLNNHGAALFRSGASS